MFYYCVYHLNIASSRKLPYLTPIPNPPNIDVNVKFVGDAIKIFPTDFFHFQEYSKQELGFCITLSVGYVEFIISKEGDSVQVAHTDDAPFLEVMRYLTGVAFGACLRFKGVLCLHASAISVNGSALVFVGPSRTGKSTLSAAFHQRNFPLISEDIVAIDQHNVGVYVRSGYAGVRLYSDTLNHLYRSSAIPNALAVHQKFLYPLDEIPIQSHLMQSLYILAARNPTLEYPRITAIDGLSALMLLTDHFYLHRFIGNLWLERDFPRLGKLITSTKIFILERTNNLHDLNITIDLLLEYNNTSKFKSS